MIEDYIELVIDSNIDMTKVMLVPLTQRWLDWRPLPGGN